MEIVACVLIGFCIDLIVGDPQNMPHPVRLIGGMISGCERIIRKALPKRKTWEILGGAVLTLIVAITCTALPMLILWGTENLNHWARLAVEAFMCYQIFATKSLRTESMRVYNHIKENDLANSRKYLSWIVGRDTENLDYPHIIRAVVETVAENASDGVIAPMLFLIIGGAPLGFLYKGINTLDSMVGYKNNKYLYFGRFSAKTDDVLNYIPARLTGLLFVIGSYLMRLDGKNAWRIFRRDRRNHASPNSGYPESACAGGLDIQLAGDALYFGKLYHKPTIGDDLRPVEAEDIVKANRLMYCAAVLALVTLMVIRIILKVVL